ncbi:hypothetical protein [uncultured Psychroserpens sp.]|uniref:hypothetical protein n=1 Tax=uncultured Psychroserpens sp. TaxID=255436 RepID=UPI0026064A84|nr:hypothetical protein [uncultured Psychroserpens sp.]
MDVKKYFEYNPDLELTVAQIGINKWDWVAIDKEDKEQAKSIMANNRFDILPVASGKPIIKYFKTDNWGDYSKVSLKHITREDNIYYRLSFIDLLRKMITDDNYLFFLSDSNEVLGLVSLNNLNCLAVYNYIYQITASLELVVSRYLEELLDEEFVVEVLKKTSDEQANKIAEQFELLKSLNNENSIFHHLYFPTIGTLLKYSVNLIKKDCPDLLQYRKKFCAGNLYWEIRNTVSHPVKPLFVNEVSVKKVNELISDYIEIKKIL